jgi:hypothetical protein
MVTAAVLESVVEFAATEYRTLPGPLPEALPVTVIHAALGAALQAQPAGAVTVTALVPPSLPNARLPGAIAMEQTGVGSSGD